MIILVGVLGAGPEGEARRVALALAEPVTEASWFAVRTRTVLETQLRLVGFDVTEDLGASAPVLKVSVAPEVVKTGRDQVTVRVTSGPRAWTQVREAEALDQLVAGLVRQIAPALGAPWTSADDPLLPVWTDSFVVHRYLGRAEVRHRTGAHRQAALMFGRAMEVVKSGVIPEAEAGRRRAEAGLLTSNPDRFAGRVDLARAAQERAEVALQNRQMTDAVQALSSFLRYTDQWALRWRIEAAFHSAPAIFFDRTWWVQDDRQSWVIDPLAGQVTSTKPHRLGLVGFVQDHPLTLQKRRLQRWEDDRVLWSVDLPIGPRRKTKVLLTSGVLGVVGKDALAWVEVSFGRLGQVARQIEPLSSSPGGVIVRLRAKSSSPVEVALLRPGKNTPAWRTPLLGVRAAVSTRDRVVVLGDEGVVVLDAHNGKRRKAPVPASKEARLLSAEGRYAVVVHSDQTMSLIDILAGEGTARLQGPGRPVAMHTMRDGVAVGFDGGDVVFFHRDGMVMDRARVSGPVFDVRPGHPRAAGPVVITGHGLVAFSDIPARKGIVRDVDAVCRLARLHLKAGRLNDALRRATDAALRSAGRVDDFETIRAEVYAQKKGPAYARARQVALTRAQAVQNPRQSMPRFSLIGW